jgi:alpha-galactosidase
MNQQNVTAQSDAMKTSGLGAHGFEYINLDAGWTGPSDQYGRPQFNATEFPEFLEMVRHIHANGQKVGVYLNPGLGAGDVAANPPDLRHEPSFEGHHGDAADVRHSARRTQNGTRWL